MIYLIFLERVKGSKCTKKCGKISCHCVLPQTSYIMLRNFKSKIGNYYNFISKLCTRKAFIFSDTKEDNLIEKKKKKFL